MATHSSILAWKIPWTEEPGRLQYNGVTKSWTWLSTHATHTHTHTYLNSLEFFWSWVFNQLTIAAQMHHSSRKAFKLSRERKYGMCMYIYVCVCVYTHTHTYTYNGILLSHKKEWKYSSFSNMYGHRDYYIRWSKWNRDKYHMIWPTCGI